MSESFDSLLAQYESGTLSRRQLLTAMALIAAPTTTRAQQGVVRARLLHHISVRVGDVDRSEDFYRRLLGFPERRYIVGDAYALDFPDGGLISLAPVGAAAPNATVGDIDHYGIGIDNFDAPRVADELEAAGFEGVRQSDQMSVFLPDPDGVAVQLSSVTERFEATQPDRGC